MLKCYITINPISLRSLKLPKRYDDKVLAVFNIVAHGTAESIAATKPGSS